MDKRNSKESLLAHIEDLTEKMERVYQAGRSGIGYVGIANYAEREAEAARRLDSVYFGDL